MPMRASPLYTHKSGHDDATMTFVLRSVSLSVALSVLAAACALVEPPVPANTHAVANLADDITFVLTGEVRNLRAEPVQLEMRTPAGALPGAVQPASLPAQTTTNVTFYIPLSRRLVDRG